MSERDGRYSVSTALSCDADKRRLLAADTYFQESAEQLRELAGDVEGFAARHAVLLLKPDAVVARRLQAAIAWLVQNGFEIVAADTTRLTRTVVRSLWYFQWNLATWHRRRLVDLFAASTESLVLVVRLPEQAPIPASVLLTSLKGPTDPARQMRGQLRHTLGAPAFLLNMAHTADEPADVLRELGVYFGQNRRRAVYAGALDGRNKLDRAQDLVARLYSQSPTHDLAFAPAADRLLRAIRRWVEHTRLEPWIADEARTAMDEVDVRTERWRVLLELALRYGAKLDPWDTTVVGSVVLPMKRKGDEPVLGGVTIEQWRRHLREDAVAVVGQR